MALDDKQSIATATLLPQDQPDLIDPVGLTQVGVDHEHTVPVKARITGSKYLGSNTIPRLQHRARRYLGRFIGEEMHQHIEARTAKV